MKNSNVASAVTGVRSHRLIRSGCCIAIAALLAACNGQILSDGKPIDENNTNPIGGGSGGSGSTTMPLDCKAPVPPSTPIRRLTRFEYDNTVADLLGDTTSPASELPSEEYGNGFGNDARAQSVSSFLVEKYGTVAEDIAARLTTERLANLAPCTASLPDGAAESACARTIAETLLPRAYRRPLVAGEVDELVALFELLRPASDFPSSVAGMIEAVLQGPEFLYRAEFGVPEPGRTDLLRPTGHEMASRLSYFLWGTMPDDTLRTAADAGELSTDAGVRTHATRMLADARARPVIRFFFDSLLPISSVSALERDATLYPSYNAQVGAAMREETQTFLAYQIFEGPGTWPSVFTADYTFVNETLAAFYGIPGITGTAFQKVPLDTTKRLGLLTQASIVAGTTHSNATSPVVRGGFVVNKLLCANIPLPTGDILEKVKPPDPYSGATARDRYSQHSADQVCAACHANMDPIGFALENFDAVGQWRDTENNVVINASGSAPMLDAPFNGPVELAQRISTSVDAQTCFASHWINFAYGQTIKADASDKNACSVSQAQNAFQASGYNVKELLIALAQTDAFLYLPAVRE